MEENEEITPQDIREFNEAFDKYHEAQGRHAAMRSQGKFCPPGIAKRAELDMLALRKRYEATKVFRLRNKREVKSEIMYRLASMIRSLRERFDDA